MSDQSNYVSNTIDVNVKNASLPVDVTINDGKISVGLAKINYTTTNVTTAAYVELVAATSDAINEIVINDTSGQVLIFAVGPSSGEVNKFYIPSGGIGGISLAIPAGSRIALKADSGTANSGFGYFTFLK